MWYRQLHWQILIGLVTGLLFGLVASTMGWTNFTADFIKPIGTIFVSLLKLIAIPLVIVSLIVGVSGLNDVNKLSRMGGKTIGLYLMTTVIAITIGLVVVNVIAPGKSLPIETREELMNSYNDVAKASAESVNAVEQRSLMDFFVDIVPDNFFSALGDNASMLQIVFVSILFGLGIIYLSEERRTILVNFFDATNHAIINVVNLIMKIAPYGVFALMANVIVELAGDDLSRAFDLIIALGWYSLTVLIGLSIHALIVYPTIFRIFKKMKISHFFKVMRPALLLGFSTSSSSATLPVTMERVENGLGVDEEVSSFVLPVGATVNMDGTSLYQAVAAVFIGQALGLDLSIVQQITIVLTATLASIGAAGVPGAGIIMLVIVLQSIQVPVEGIALILGVDRILDMFRTVVNIIGDATVCVSVAASENLLHPVEEEI
jgi:Na+/H+-dicarboxylate symporter